jgi:hypothetical protein
MDARAGNGDGPGFVVDFRSIGHRVLHSRNFGGNLNEKLYVANGRAANAASSAAASWVLTIHPHMNR